MRSALILCALLLCMARSSAFVHGPAGTSRRAAAIGPSLKSRRTSTSALNVHAPVPNDEDDELDPTLEQWMQSQGVERDQVRQKVKTMLQMGFVWDKDARSWGRGQRPNERKDFAQVRSSLRTLSVGSPSGLEEYAEPFSAMTSKNIGVTDAFEHPAARREAAEPTAQGKEVPAEARKALERVRDVAKKARTDSLMYSRYGSASMVNNLAKLSMSQTAFPWLWAAWELTIAGELAAFGMSEAYDGFLTLHALPMDASTAIMLLAAVPVGLFQSLVQARMVGYEGGSRVFERSMVDASLGSHALPAVHEWRAENPLWKAGYFLANIIKAPTIAALYHGILQQSLRGVPPAFANFVAMSPGLLEKEGATAAPVFGIIATAMVASFLASPTRDLNAQIDGIVSEVEALREAEEDADKFYRFHGDTKDDMRNAAAAARVFRFLASSYRETFAKAATAVEGPSIFAFFSTAAAGAALEFCHGNLAAPAAFLAVAGATHALAMPPKLKDTVVVEIEQVEEVIRQAHEDFDNK